MKNKELDMSYNDKENAARFNLGDSKLEMTMSMSVERKMA